MELWIYMTSFCKSLRLHIFQDLNKRRRLRFHALVWLHKQLGSTTVFFRLPLVDQLKELRILFQLQICPSIQAHHIIQLSVRFWMQRIQITCYRIQRRGGTERACCGAPVQGLSPMSTSCTSITIPSNELNLCPALCAVQKTQTKKPKLTLSEATGLWWQRCRW